MPLTNETVRARRLDRLGASFLAVILAFQCVQLCIFIAYAFPFGFLAA